MKKNMGSIDRAARIVVAVALLVLAVILAVTGLVGSCPLYTALHRDTLNKSFSH